MSVLIISTTNLAAAFQAPSIEYRSLLPMLIVFGVAVAGVLVEAFMGRAGRFTVQLVLAIGGLIAAFVSVVVETPAYSSRHFRTSA